MIRTYTDLMRLQTYEERFKYLALHGQVGEATFGFDRYLNQGFYRSTEWRNLRHRIIVRDNACDLAAQGFEIPERATIHHLNPMRVQDIVDGDEEVILNPEYLICVSHLTHNAIHYGRSTSVPRGWTERQPGDTKLW